MRNINAYLYRDGPEVLVVDLDAVDAIRSRPDFPGDDPVAPPLYSVAVLIDGTWLEVHCSDDEKIARDTALALLEQWKDREHA